MAGRRSPGRSTRAWHVITLGSCPSGPGRQRPALSWSTRLGSLRTVEGGRRRFVPSFPDFSCDHQLKTLVALRHPALRFPATHITAFVEAVPPPVRPILTELLKLFARLCAYSAQSGLTPIALSTFFGPLLFGLGPESAPFSHTYAAYLRSSHAAEHLILCNIRNVEMESLSTATSMPPRLKDWIRGYPVMISPLRDLEKPRRGSKLVRVASSRRNTRLYTSDLVKNCASWGTEGDMPHRPEWQRIAPNGQLPKYSDDYRRRLDIPASYAPSISSFGSRSSLDTPSSLSSPPSSSAKALAFSLSIDNPVGHSLLDTTPVKTFNSLNDLRWGEFEELGFSEADSQKLQFDLNEGARQVGLILLLIVDAQAERICSESYSKTGYDDLE